MTPSAIDLRIEGMTCAGCVARVVRAIEKIPGAQAEVSLIEHRARISGIDLATAVAAIRRAGYAASPITTAPTPAATQASIAEGGASGVVGQGNRSATWARAFAIVALSLMLFEMAAMTLGSHVGLGHGLIPLWLQALLATIMQFWVGAPIARKGLTSALRGRASMETLILLGTASAYLWSMGLWLGVLSASDSHVYFEASVVVLAMMHIGQHLQDRAQARTLAALAPFLHESTAPALRLDPQHGGLTNPRAEVRTPCPAQALRSGDQIWLDANTLLPCDGVILEGSSEFDESGLTGEALPVTREVGDRVIGGTRNVSSAVIVRVEGDPDQWRQSQLRSQMMAALASRAPIAQWADRIAAVFVPLVAALALVNLGAQTFWGPGFATALERTIAMLVIACPCALGLATPMAVATGLARGAQNGWLFRNAASLQKGADIDRVVFDKTGTLTEGRPRLVGIASSLHPARAITAEDFPKWLAAAVAAQEGSPHPLAGAFWSQAAGRAVPLVMAEPLQHAGLGIQALTSVGRVVIGKPNWVAQSLSNGRAAVSQDDHLWPAASQVDVAIDGVWQGRLWADDSLKEDAAQAIDALRSHATGVAVLSGDRQEAVAAAANALGLGHESVGWGLSPEDKAARLQQWQSRGEKVAMVGDGINDLSAMAQADLAIALSAGASITLKTADITLTNSHHLMAVPRVIAFCKTVRRRIIENLAFAFAFNLLALPMAAVGALTPAIAGAAMALSSVAVVGNALRLLKA